MTNNLELKEIPLENISTGTSQARQRKVGEDMDLLIASIKKWGLIEPISVFQKEDGSYEVIAGQRRLLAHQKLGKSTINAVIRPPPKDEIAAKAMSLAENVTRSDMVSQDILDACDMFYKRYGSIKMVAEELGLTHRFVRKYVKFARLPTIVQSAFDEGKLDMDTALEATDALKFDEGESKPEDVLQLALEMNTLTRAQQKDVKETLQHEPEKPVHEAIEEVKTGKESRKITIEVTSDTYGKIDQFKQDNKIKAIASATEELAEIGLEKSGY